jgi:nucleoside phosphorylase
VRKAIARGAFRPRVEVCGIGPSAAERAAETALAGPPMRRALVVGLCGFLVPEFGVGDVAIYGSLRAERGSLEIDPELVLELAAALPSAHSVRGVESAVIVTSPRAKTDLAQRFGAQAVDMESFTLVERLKLGGVSAAVVRIGSDASGDELPDLSAALDAQGNLHPLSTARALLRRPAAGLRLARNGLRALAVLGRTVEQLCAYASEAVVPKP